MDTGPLSKLYKSYFKELFETVHEYWDDIYKRTTFYGYHYQKRREDIEWLLDDASLSADRKILDAGCGAGAYIPMYLSRRLHVDGIDISESMIAKATELYRTEIEIGNLSLKVGDMEALPYMSDSFDLVVSAGALMYLPAPDKALSEFSRVLRIGGYAIVNVDNHRNLAAIMDLPRLGYRFVRKFIARFKHDAQARGRSELAQPITKSYRPEQLIEMLYPHGFEVINERGCGFGPIRIFGFKVLPGKVNIWLYKITENLFANRPLTRWGFTYSVLAKKVQ